MPHLARRGGREQSERTGWLFRIERICMSNLNHHSGCAFGAATPPGQEGRFASLNASLNEFERNLLRDDLLFVRFLKNECDRLSPIGTVIEREVIDVHSYESIDL